MARKLTTEQLAEELHRTYRAAFKALHIKTDVYGEPRNHFINCNGAHDHGWEGCTRKKYFMRRAEAFQKYLEKNQ